MYYQIRSLVSVVVCALFLGALPSLSQAQDAAASSKQADKVRQANAECFACHSPAGVQKPPKEGLDLAKLRTLIKHPEAFEQSDHQRQLCTKCHNEGYDEHPHEADAKDNTSTCTDCHSKKADLIEKQFEKSVHANLGEAMSCTSCHDPHVMRIADKQNDPARIVAQDNQVCLACHDSDEKFARFAPDKKQRPKIDDIHSWLPNTRLHWKAVRCVECHTPEVGAKDMLSHQILSKDKAERNCFACHGANSTLNTRLYRHLSSEEQHRFGFANSVILSNSYVVGTTRHPLLDSLVLASFAAMLLGLLAHGFGRFVTRQKHAATADEPAAEPVYLISLWVRLWHWFNAALIVILSVTGFSLHFADPALPLVDFALAVRIHNAAGVTLVGTYVFFFFANILSGNWRQFVPKLDGIVQRVLAQGLWYAFGIFRGEPHVHEPNEEEHFNVLQALTYSGVMYALLPVIIVSGLIFLYPQFAPDTLFGFNGLLPVALVHYLAAVAIVLFLLSHIYLGTTGRTVGQMFKTMITGWHKH